MKDSKKIRFAVLVDKEQLKFWQIESIKTLIANPEIHFIGFIKPKQKINPYSSIKQSIGFRYLERKLRKQKLFQSDLITNHFSEQSFEVDIIQKKNRFLISRDACEELKLLNLDFALRFGFGLLSGEILEIPRWGIWSFHHGNMRFFRGGPPLFWEMYLGYHQMHFTLQCLTEKLDGGKIINEGSLQIIPHSYSESLRRLYTASILSLNKAVYLSKLKNPKENGALKNLGKVYHLPCSITVANFIFKQFIAKLYFHVQQLFSAEKWNIGFLKQDIDFFNNQTASKVDWLREAPKNEYRADAFLLNENEILCERYFYKNGEGKLEHITLNNGEIKSKVFQADGHFSFPVSYTLNGEKLFIPENYQSKKIQLFKLNNSSIKATKLLLNGEWVDPVLFYWQDHYYLFASPKEFSNSHLNLFYANSLDDNFQAHPMNPIVVDGSNARAAGPIISLEDGRLIRPAQCSLNTYGEYIQFNLIKTLSPEKYEEERIGSLKPDKKSPYANGLHSISILNKKILIDAKRSGFIPASFGLQLKRKIFRRYT